MNLLEKATALFGDLTPSEEAAVVALDERPEVPGVSVTCTPERDYTRAWARVLVDRGNQAGEIPLFGSPEWCRLPDSDPRKAAAVVRAAVAWLTEGEELAFTLAQEDYDRRREDDAHWEQIHAGRRDLVAAALDEQRTREHRQAHAEAMAERAHSGSDYSGGPVRWEPTSTLGGAA